MSSSNTCPKCQRPVDGAAPHGLCPACLLEAAAAEGAAATPPEVEVSTLVAASVTEHIGDRIGRYKLREKIGEGGFGVVYVAEQEEPVRRRVALKVIKMGMDTREVIARFEAERQALALMDHPNIARVLDAGATEAGRPYFVMELVKGIRITDYCDQHQLTTVQRLNLFIQVCQAVQHAHQKGIIHRDIKPSNILVVSHDGVAAPKVIDFGIAKATQGRLTDLTIYTELNQFMGTPAYMSPEQAELSGLDIDTRADIYALGVLLYQLLTGQTPFDGKELARVGLDEIRRTIREVEPVKPSTRLRTLLDADRTTVARLRQTESGKLAVTLRGDLDWIVMKALEKDRTRRYETANGFARDIECFLADEPVSAAAPSSAYRFGKFARRNKTGLAVAAGFAVILIAGTVTSTWQAVRAIRAEAQVRKRIIEVGAERDAKGKALDAAEVARQDAESIARFLTEVFQSPAPARDGRTITVAETLDKAAKRLEADLAGQPRRRANLQSTLGSTYCALGLYREAIPLQEKARDYYLATVGPEHPDTLRAMQWLASSYRLVGRGDEALKLCEEGLLLRRKMSGPEHPETLTSMADLGLSYNDTGRWDKALKLHEELLPLCRKVLGPEHVVTLAVLGEQAISYHFTGRRGEALKLFEAVLPLCRRVLGPEHPMTLKAMAYLGISYSSAGRVDEALELFEAVLPLCRKVLGPEHPDTLRVMNNLTISYSDTGREDEALKLHEDLLALRRKMLGQEHPDTLRAMQNLASSYHNVGRRDEALKLGEEVLTLRRKVLGPEHPDTLKTMNNLVVIYDAAGRRDEALKLQGELAIVRTSSRAAESQLHGGETSPSGPSAATLDSEKYSRADFLYRRGRFAEAEPLYREVLQSELKRFPATNENALGTAASLARNLADWAWAERDSTNKAKAYDHTVEAERLLRDCFAVRQRGTNANSWRTVDSKSRLGFAVVVLAVTDAKIAGEARMARFAEAEPLLLESAAALQAETRVSSAYKRDSLQRLVRLYQAWRKPDKLAEWKQKLEAFDRTISEKRAEERTGAK